MTPSGLPATSYARLKPAMPRQPQPSSRVSLHFGGGTAATTAPTDGEDTLEKTPVHKTEEELRKEEEARIRKLAEERINSRYSAKVLEKLDEKRPTQRKTIIENAIEAQQILIPTVRGAYIPLIKRRDDFINRNRLTGTQKAAVDETLKYLQAKEKEEEHYEVFQHIYGKLQKLKPSPSTEPHYIQQLALNIMEEAIQHPKNNKEKLIQEEIARINAENEPSFFARPVIWARDSISNGCQNSYFYMKDKYIDAVGGAAYWAKRGATVGQDLASWAGTGYLTNQAINASGLSTFPWSLGPAMAVGYIAPALGNRQKNSLAGGAALHGLANAAGEMSVYGVPVKPVALWTSRLVTGSGLVPNAVYSGLWNTGKTAGGHIGNTAAYTASLASWPLVKAANITSKVGSLFSRSPKPEPVIKAEAVTLEDTLGEDDETVTTDESTIQPELELPKTEEKKPATRSGWFSSFWPASTKPAETVIAPASASKTLPLKAEEAEEEESATLQDENEIAAEDSHTTPSSKSPWSFLGLGGGRKPKEESATTHTDATKPETTIKSETEARTEEPVLPLTEESAPVIPKAVEKKEQPELELPKPELTPPPPVPVPKPPAVKPVPDTVEVVRVVPAKPKKTVKPPEKKPQTTQKSALERYTWPAVHVVGGTSLIASGALLHLPIITAPIGMGMMAAGSAWTLYGIYQGYQAAKA